MSDETDRDCVYVEKYRRPGDSKQIIRVCGNAGIGPGSEFWPFEAYRTLCEFHVREQYRKDLKNARAGAIHRRTKAS